jgi:DNA sulfur modification protein DndD
MRIVKWEASGLRCPDHEIEVSSPLGDGPNVTLIQMPNGTGKTTTLTLLRACLSGTVDRMEEHAVRQFQGNDGEVERGYFRVTVEVDKRLVTFSADFDFEQGLVTQTTTLAGGIKSGFHPPKGLEIFLDPDFVEFFVFDGELAESLIDRSRTDAQLAIDSLFRLRMLHGVLRHVDDYWERRVSDRTATETRGLSRRRNKVDRLKTRIKDLEVRQRNLLRRKGEAEQELLDLERRFKEALEEQEEKQQLIHRAQIEFTSASSDVDRCLGELTAAMRHPLALSPRIYDRLQDLKGSLDRAKLPESAAREFFMEVAQEAECICGREIDDDARNAIQTRAANYLASDDVALLNAMKAQIGDEATDPDAELTAAFAEKRTELRNRVRVREEKRTARDLAESAAAAGDPELEQAKTLLNELRAEIDEISEDLQRFDDPTESRGDDDTWGLEILRRRHRTAEKKLAEITNTLELKAKRDVLSAILHEAIETARVSLAASLTQQTNERMAVLMPHNRIRLKAIAKSLEMHSQDKGSTGENLSVAYAFLSTLFERSGQSLPFVVDSPAGPIDLAVRAEVAELVPRLTQQFIAFVISSEREGFLDPLIRACEDDVQLVTLFRKGVAERDEAAKRVPGTKETRDGLLVPGEEFFRRFHLDEDEEREHV